MRWPREPSLPSIEGNAELSVIIKQATKRCGYVRKRELHHPRALEDRTAGLVEGGGHSESHSKLQAGLAYRVRVLSQTPKKKEGLPKETPMVSMFSKQLTVVTCRPYSFLHLLSLTASVSLWVRPLYFRPSKAEFLSKIKSFNFFPLWLCLFCVGWLQGFKSAKKAIPRFPQVFFNLRPSHRWRSFWKAKGTVVGLSMGPTYKKWSSEIERKTVHWSHFSPCQGPL